MKRLCSIAISVLFIPFIFLPLTVSLFTGEQEISQTEKRKLASLPEFHWQWDIFKEYTDSFEDYFNDHFGLREQLIGLYNLLYVKILKNSPNPLVVMGKGDWIFYSGEGTLDDFLGLDQPSLYELESWKQILKDRQEWLADQGVQYLLVIPPNKMMVYPEKLPWRIGRMAGDTALDLFIQHLEKMGEPIPGFVNLRAEFEEKKNIGDLYFHTDTHWNNRGAFLAYQNILGHILQEYPQTYMLDDSDLHEEKVTHIGDITLLLQLGDYLQESNVSKYNIKNRCADKVYSPLKDMVHPDESLAGKTMYLPVVNGCQEKDLTVLLIHDSFGLFLRDYFSQTFKRVVFSSYIDLKDLKTFIRKEKPHVVIDERVARNIRGVMEHDQEIENYILKKHYSSLPDSLLTLETNWNELDIRTHDLQARKGDDGVSLKSIGKDPFFECFVDIPPDQKSLFFKVLLSSSVSTELEVFYAVKERQPYDSKRKLSRKIQKGENELYIRLPVNALASFRFDTGRGEGEFLLKELSIIREK
ncbi:MAG: hypothetical protein GY705_21540 [Bacteroidetes bacterium]|nr:hypothetical protein [Bacteroidota bacterium]